MPDIPTLFAESFNNVFINLSINLVTYVVAPLFLVGILTKFILRLNRRDAGTFMSVCTIVCLIFFAKYGLNLM